MPTKEERLDQMQEEIRELGMSISSFIESKNVQTYTAVCSLLGLLSMELEDQRLLSITLVKIYQSILEARLEVEKQRGDIFDPRNN